jgi:hypothetical protein
LPSKGTAHTRFQNSLKVEQASDRKYREDFLPQKGAKGAKDRLSQEMSLVNCGRHPNLALAFVTV